MQLFCLLQSPPIGGQGVCFVLPKPLKGLYFVILNGVKNLFHFFNAESAELIRAEFHRE